MIKNWQGIAFNAVPSSSNEIHSEKMAKEFGFKGGLVPGVTVAAYLVHPAIEAWGREWLNKGFARIKIKSPLYDGEKFDVEILHSENSSYQSQLVRSDGTISATAEISLPANITAPPPRRGDPFPAPDIELAKATPDSMRKLQENGCFAMPMTWNTEHPMWTYLKNPNGMAHLHQQTDGGQFGNISFILGCSNRILAQNIFLNPWVHLETSSQNYHEIPLGTKIIVEANIVDLFSKKGHEFVDAEVNLFDANDNTCLTSIQFRAIYQLRGM